MRTPMPWPLLLVFSLLAALSSPPTLPAQGLLSGHTSNIAPDTTQQFASETGLPLIEPSIQPQELPISREPGAWESAKLRQLADGMLKPLQIRTEQAVSVQFIFGGPINAGEGVNLALSYGFSKGIEIRGYGNIYDSFNLYPALRLGFLIARESIDYESSNEEYLGYGMIEGYRHFGQENFGASAIVGVGVGGYWHDYTDLSADVFEYYTSRESGIGLVLSAGVQARVWRILGELRLYRTPGFSKLLVFANVGVQVKSKKEIWIISGLAAIPFAMLVFVLIVPGS